MGLRYPAHNSPLLDSILCQNYPLHIFSHRFTALRFKVTYSFHLCVVLSSVFFLQVLQPVFLYESLACMLHVSLISF